MLKLTMVLLKFIQNPISKIFTILLSMLIIVFIYPVLILFYFPCWVYKKLVTFFVQKNQNYGQILEGLDAILAGKSPYTNPMCSLLPYFTLADKLEVSLVVNGLKEKILKPGHYPELRQKIVQKYGYHFWYNVDNFKVEDHVRNLNPDCPNMQVTRSELRNLINKKLKWLPFEPDRSPWEFIVVSNYIDDRNLELRSVLLLRVNHCLMDGYSIVNLLLMKLATKPWKSITAERQHHNSFVTIRLTNLYNTLMLLISGPYHFLKTNVLCNDKHEFVKNVFKPDYKDNWNSECNSAVSVNRLRSLRESYGVSMSALITALFGQAAYKTMKRLKTKNLTKTIHGFHAYPLPGHTNELTNHFTCVRIPIQVNEKDPVETLKFVEKEFKILRNSVKPLVFFYFSKMMALAPLSLRYFPKNMSPSTFLLTNFPGPSGPCDIFGCRWKQLNVAAKGSGGKAFLMASTSINGEFMFDVGSPDCNLSSQEDIHLLFNDLVETLSDLESTK